MNRRTPALFVAAICQLGFLSLGCASKPSASGNIGRERIAGIPARQVWAPALDVLGAPSPDGRYLSYIHWETGDVAIRDLQTSQNRILTKQGTWDSPEQYAQSPIWSPDGEMIAYGWTIGDSAELRVASVDDGVPRTLYRSDRVNHVRPEHWSRDGRILALFGLADGNHQIAIVSTHDGSIKVVKSLDSRTPTSMSFSPDGRYISYDWPPQEDTPRRDIYLISADGTDEIAMFPHPANDYGPTWSPGGDIVFASDRSGRVDAWIGQVSGGRPRGTPQLIKGNVEGIFPMGFSRDGAFWYALATFENSGDVYVTSLDPRAEKIDSVPRLLVHSHPGRNTSPAWSPDGRYLAYVSQSGSVPSGLGSAALVIRNVESGEERELFPRLERLLAPRHSPPRWSPDGRLLLLSGRDTRDRLGLFLVDVFTGDVSLLVDAVLSEGRPTRPRWAADNRHIYYIRSGAGSQPSRVMVFDRETAREEELFRGSVNNLAVSPNGELLALSNEQALSVMTIANRQTRTLHRVEGSAVINDVGGLEWTPDGRQLLFVRGQRPNPRLSGQVWAISVVGGAPHSIGLSAAELERRPGIQRYGIRELAIHPREPRLAFTAGLGGQQAEVWMLQNVGDRNDVGTLDMMPAAQAIPILTQQLMDALPGDVSVWRRYLSDRVVYVSEAGDVATKDELLRAFVPFPQGLAGSIQVKNPRVTDFGEVAISVFDAHEKQTVYDQQIEVNYRTTHTWRRENGRWRLIAAQNLVLARDPGAMPIDTRRLADYVGTYELSGMRRYRVEQRGDVLVGGRENSELTPLIPVGDNVFVDSGSSLGILRIFVRGRTGAVERMVQRRKFADTNWLKVPTARTGGTQRN